MFSFKKKTKTPVVKKKEPNVQQKGVGASLNYWYARLNVRLFTSDRIAVYRKLKSLIRNRFSLMEALERLYQIASKDGKNPDDTMAIALSAWMASVRKRTEPHGAIPQTHYYCRIRF